MQVMNKKTCFKPQYRPIVNAYLFLMIPFITLLLIKVNNVGMQNGMLGMLKIADWSLISFVIFSQSICSYMTAFGEYNIKARDPHYFGSVFIKYIILGIVPSTFVIWSVNTEDEPSNWVYVLQIVVFIYASRRFLIDGINVQRMKYEYEGSK